MFHVQKSLGDGTHIDRWQPKLNFPFIQIFLKRTALGFRPGRRRRWMEFGRFGLILWRKLRKRMLALNQPQNIARSRQQAWELLYDLSTFSEASYRACRIIRSHQVTDIEVYAMVRLSNSLEQPIKHGVRKLLQSALKYRKISWPVSSLPLRLPFLAHDSCKYTTVASTSSFSIQASAGSVSSSQRKGQRSASSVHC